VRAGKADGPVACCNGYATRYFNGLKTAALLGLLTSLILVVGYWFGGSAGLVFAVFVALAMNGFSYFFSDRIALRAMGARPSP
jgi:heat shock protein HtpX